AVGHVVVEDVDVVEAEPLERGVDGLEDLLAAARRRRALGYPAQRVGELRRDDGPLAAAPQRFAEHLLARAGAVGRRRVEERDALLERLVDDLPGLVG